MAYANLAAVQNLVSQFTITATSKPTVTQAGVIIADTQNEIDVALAGQGVVVPVAAPAHFLAWLGFLTGYGAAAAVLKSAFPGATGPEETPAYAFWEKRYQDGLKGIRDGSMLPGDIVVIGTGSFVLPSSYLTRNPDTNEDIGLIAEPLFKMDKVY